MRTGPNNKDGGPPPSHTHTHVPEAICFRSGRSKSLHVLEREIHTIVQSAGCNTKDKRGRKRLRSLSAWRALFVLIGDPVNRRGSPWVNVPDQSGLVPRGSQGVDAVSRCLICD